MIDKISEIECTTKNLSAIYMGNRKNWKKWRKNFNFFKKRPKNQQNFKEKPCSDIRK